MALSTAQQVRLILVQQQGKLEISSTEEIDTWVNYILSGLPNTQTGIFTQAQIGNNTILSGPSTLA